MRIPMTLLFLGTEVHRNAPKIIALLVTIDYDVQMQPLRIQKIKPSKNPSAPDVFSRTKKKATTMICAQFTSTVLTPPTHPTHHTNTNQP